MLGFSHVLRFSLLNRIFLGKKNVFFFLVWELRKCKKMEELFSSAKFYGNLMVGFTVLALIRCLSGIVCDFTGQLKDLSL